MKIKRISDYTLEECHKYLNENPDGMERMAVENQIDSILKQMEDSQDRDEILNRIRLEEREKDVDWIDFRRVIDKMGLKDLLSVKILLYCFLTIFIFLLICSRLMDGVRPDNSDFESILHSLKLIYYIYNDELIDTNLKGCAFLFLLIIITFAIIRLVNCFHTSSLKLIYNIEKEEKVKSYRRTMDKKGNIGLHKCCRFRIIQILPFQFNNIYYCGGSAYVCMKEGKRGVYNVVKKKMVIEVDYDSIEVLSDGTLKAFKNGIYSRFTTEGYRIIE